MGVAIVSGEVWQHCIQNSRVLQECSEYIERITKPKLTKGVVAALSKYSGRTPLSESDTDPELLILAEK